MAKERALELNLFVGNLSSYVEGKPNETWLSLPATNSEIQEALGKIGVETQNQEIYISDIEIPNMPQLQFLRQEVDDYTNLFDLNMVMHLVNLHKPDPNAMELCLQENHGLTLEAIGNLILQSEEIPYYEFDFEGAEHCGYMSPEEKYAYTVNEKNGVYDQLKELGMAGYVDFEEFGRDKAMSGEIILGEEGWYEPRANNIRLDLYTKEQLLELAGLAEALEKTAEQTIEEISPKI